MAKGLDHRFSTKLKEVSVGDLFHIVLFLLALIPAKIYQIKRKNLWLICENKNEARDNGYWLFKYITENHPECDVVYAINPNCKDHKKVEKLGKTISYGTFIHWIYYLAARVNISSQKNGKPNAAVCYLLEVYGIRKNKRVFLQHGITQNDVSFVHYENSKFSLVITTTARETEYMKNHFNYPGNEIQMAGMARFDRLYEASKENRDNSKTLLIMPTWRSWISPPSHAKSEYTNVSQIRETEYYKAWNSLINSTRLKEIIESVNGKIVFYQHREMQRFRELFVSDDSLLEIVMPDTGDVQNLLINSDYLITDYSSVAFDFAYMDKELCYYQFDYDRYRSEHYSEGYFDYQTDGFGPVSTKLDSLLDNVELFFKREYDNEKKYSIRRKEFFNLKDNENCKRNYELIKELANREV